MHYHHFFKFKLLRLLVIGAALLATPANAEDNCEIPANWVTDGVPDPAIRANGDFNSFCHFHTWAWNAFLWSMEKVNDNTNILRFETFPTQEDTINASFGSKIGSEIVLPILQPRAAKNDHPIDAVAQAGTFGIMVAQNKRAIYYSQYVDPQMYDEIIERNWNNAAGLAAEDPNARFEVGNIEYKAAWAIVDENSEIPGAYTRQAMVPKLVTVMKDGVPTIQVPENPEYIQETVALIGLHVVGWVKDHPEAIWATFSPRNIVPIVPTDDDGNITIKPDDVVSDSSTPFYSAGTTLSDCNQLQTPIQKLDDSTQEFTYATQACQIYKDGTIGSGKSENANVIDQINKSAQSSLPKDWPSADYEEIGAVWSEEDTGINETFQEKLLGSTVLSSPVIETFTQTDVGQNNCFSCHNSLQYQPEDPDIPPLHASMLNLSHFLMQIYIKTYAKDEQ